mgnify:CR=1 FL=1
MTNLPACKNVNLTEQVNRFLQNSYLFRYNLLTDETEYRPANAADKTFVTIGKTGTEYPMPRSPCPGNSMLGQRYQPFSFLQTCT